MTSRRKVLLGALLIAALPQLAIAQNEVDELDEGVVIEEVFEPKIDANAWELHVFMGFLNLSHDLLYKDGVVIDVENPEEAIYADMSLKGETSFSPQIRFSRTFGSRFAWENSLGFAVGDYEQQTTAGSLVGWKNEGKIEFTEQEIQKGSYWLWLYHTDLAWYPRGNDGRMQPYLNLGVGGNSFFLDTRYVDNGAHSLAYSVGAGLRIVGDELMSVRFEVRNYWSAFQMDPSAEWERGGIPNLSGDGRVSFPISTLAFSEDVGREAYNEMANRLGITTWDDPAEDPPSAFIPQIVEEFEEVSFTNLWYSVSLTSSF